jgi:hypothetical protein
MWREQGRRRGRRETRRHRGHGEARPGQTEREALEIHYRNSLDLCGRSTTETAWISAGDPLPKQPGSLREIHYRNSLDLCGRSTTETARIFLCTFAFISPLRFELASNLEEGIEDRFADVVEFRLKMIDEFMQPFIHDLFDV